MSTIDASATHGTTSARDAFVQIAGLLGANHLLTRVAPRLLPGAASSRIETDWALFGEAALADLGQAILTLAIVPGVVEEVVFRGLLFAVVRHVSNAGWAIGVSALAFGGVHLDLHLSTIATLLGLQLGCLRHVHGLGLAIAAHVANNLGVLLLRYLDEAGRWPWTPLEGPAVQLASGALALGLAGMAWASLAQAMRRPAAAQATARAGEDRTTDGP